MTLDCRFFSSRRKKNAFESFFSKVMDLKRILSLDFWNSKGFGAEAALHLISFQPSHLISAHIEPTHTVPKEGPCMAWSHLQPCMMLELLVMMFQVTGVISLCMSRLVPPTSTRWVARGRVGFVIAMIGLGFTGALCGQHHSAFALFAGVTMTLLLIGMTAGSGQTDHVVATRNRVSTEPNLAS